MMYTLKLFLDEHVVSGITLLTGKEDFANIRLRTSSIQDPPFDSEFFERDSLIITKFMGLESDEEAMMELIRLASEAEVAALVWALHEKTARIPKSVVDYAVSLHLPLFQVPWEYPFSKIQDDLRDAIRRKEVADFETLQQSLFHCFFDSYPLEETAPIISRHLQRPTRIIDPLGQLISESAVHGNIPPKERTLRAAITINGLNYGEVRLHLTGPDDSLRGRVEELEKYVAFPLSLWFNRRKIEQGTQYRIHSDFVWNLANGNSATMLDMHEQGKHLGFDLSRPYICVAMKAELASDTGASIFYLKGNAEVAEGIELLLQQVAKQFGRAVMTANLNLDFAFFLEFNENDNYAFVERYIDQVEALIGEQYPEVQCYWGISEPPTKDVGFDTLYRQASQALTHCVTVEEPGQRFTYHRTRKAAIIAAISKSEDIKKGAAEVLGELLAYDQVSKIDLMHTLTVFISTNYNASQTAKILHLNRQSLLYRLDKIEQLTRMSLRDHDDLLVLEIFSRIYMSY